MTRIECYVCNEFVEVETRGVTLPYVCNDCEQAAEFNDKIKPAVPTPVVVKTDGDYPFIPLNEDDATVENTTLLIEDLEEQVAAQKELNDQANALIEDMSTQLTEDAATIGDKDRLIHGLEIGIEELNKTIVLEDGRYTALYQKYWTLFDSNERLRERGFFARLFNR